MEKIYFTIKELAILMRVSRQAIDKWILSGDLKATKPGKKWLIRKNDLEEYLISKSNHKK